MKKKLFSVKKFTLICCALAVTLGTCIAATANTNESDKDVSAANQSSNGTLIAEESSSATAVQYANRFDKYEEYGLTYNQTTENLYYNGELVRYFEDYYPVDENAYTGIDYFNEKGTVDVHGVRDLSKLTYNADASYDPSGKLTGVQPYSQEEFDARDINKLKNPAQAITSAASNTMQDNAYPYPYTGSNFQLVGESKEAFKIYAEFGLTYDDDNVFRYNGKKVRRFYDERGTLAFTRDVVNDYDKSIDLTAVRDSNGKLTGLSAAGKDEFEQRTANIEQSRKEWQEFLKNNPNVTSYATAEFDGVYTSNTVASNETDSYNNPTVTGITSDTAYAGSHNSDYVDISLSEYLDYGVSYDKTQKTWLFNGKSIDFLIDEGHQIHVNFSADNTDRNFVGAIEVSNGVYLLVTRKSNGKIDKISEMTVEEAVKAIQKVFN